MRFCTNCGVRLSDEALFCGDCGTAVITTPVKEEPAMPETVVKPETATAPEAAVKPETETAPETAVKPETATAPETAVKTETAAIPETPPKTEPAGFFVDDGERAVCVLGEQHYRDWREKGAADGDFCVLSDSRVYVKDRSETLANVAGSDVRQSKWSLTLIAAVAVLAGCAIMFVGTRIDSSNGLPTYGEQWLSLIIFTVIGAGLLALYLLRRKTFFVLFIGGDRLRFDVKRYGKESVKQFHDALTRAKTAAYANDGAARKRDSKIVKKRKRRVLGALGHFATLVVFCYISALGIFGFAELFKPIYVLDEKPCTVYIDSGDSVKGKFSGRAKLKDGRPTGEGFFVGRTDDGDWITIRCDTWESGYAQNRADIALTPRAQSNPYLMLSLNSGEYIYNYSGEVYDSQFDGEGTLYQDGTRYAGMFKKGVRSGRGTLTYLTYYGEAGSSGASSYSFGDITDSFFYSRGGAVKPDTMNDWIRPLTSAMSIGGWRYEGLFENGGFADKTGFTYDSNTRFEGTFDGFYPSNGVIYHESGSQSWRYTGDLLNGVPDGYGRIDGRNILGYEGRFNNAVPDGYGTLYFPEGYTVSGNWKGAEFEDGMVYGRHYFVGGVFDGALPGVGMFYDDDGTSKKCRSSEEGDGSWLFIPIY